MGRPGNNASCLFLLYLEVESLKSSKVLSLKSFDVGCSFIRCYCMIIVGFGSPRGGGRGGRGGRGMLKSFNYLLFWWTGRDG